MIATIWALIAGTLDPVLASVLLDVQLYGSEPWAQLQCLDELRGALGYAPELEDAFRDETIRIIWEN